MTGPGGANTAPPPPRTVGAVHPRVRGALSESPEFPRSEIGPSPRARGSPQCGRPRSVRLRSIPACAGLSCCSSAAARAASVHPRVRGALWKLFNRYGLPNGPSPRARGSRGTRRSVRVPPRSIPACAGLSADKRRERKRTTVHPRVRGALADDVDDLHGVSGPSPRARGSRRTKDGRGRERRSIPACAGLSSRRAAPGCRWPVHPRVRGALVPTRDRLCHPPGPSPRAQGSPAVRSPECLFPRSIPACAGLSDKKEDE